MNRLPLRLKITAWFAAALVLVSLLTYVAVLSVSGQILQKTIRDNLIETVEKNYNEVEYYADLTQFDPHSAHFIAFESGYLAVEDDFLEQVNQVSTALYGAEGLLYGENPVLRATKDLKFSDSRLQTVKIKGVRYYIFDRKLTGRGLNGLWLRGVVPETQGAAQTSTISRICLIALLLIDFIACIGGYYIVKRMLRPIRQIADTAQQIGQSSDLKKRIELGAGRDELHRLASTFNRMFDRLEAVFEAERRFISDASHELRTPVSVIQAQCEYILEQPRAQEEYAEAFGVVQRQNQKLAAMIGDMLDFTRLEAGVDRYPMEELDLTALVQTVCGDLAHIGEKGIALACEADEGIRARANRELFTNLLTNLIANAYRYGKQDGHIWVGLTRRDGALRLTVADDGIGIAESDQEKIFERFYQADRSRGASGAGLGLPLAREIARFHGGEITVTSSPGAGSTFEVVIAE